MGDISVVGVQADKLRPLAGRQDTEAIWQTFGGRLRRYIRSHVADTVDADDILQDVFLKIHTSLGTLRDDSRLLNWLYQIARHAIVDYYRHQRPLMEIPETLAGTDEDEDDLSQQLAYGLREMVAKLPDKYREALILSEFQGLPQQTVADRLGISLSGAKSRIQRARELLKGQLLQCCHFELDRLGRVIDYGPRCGCFAANAAEHCMC